MKFRLLVISTLITSFLFGEPPEKAIRYHEALKTRPMNEQLFSRFYDAWLEEAESEDLSRYLSESVSGWEGHVLMARYQMRVGKRKEAIESLTKSVKDAPENMNLKLMRAKLQIQELDFKSAVSDLEVVQKSSEGEVKLESTRLLGMSLLRLEEVDRALELWSNELEKSDAGMEFVDAAAVEGEYLKAAELCQKLIGITKDPYDKIRATVKLGELQGLGGKAEQALTTLKEALDSTGNDSWLEKEILRKSDLILARQGDAGAEAIFYQELAEKHGQRVQIKLAYARILASQDQWDNSQNIFKELLQANPNDHELRADFISLLVTGEKFEDALRELDVLIDQLGSAEPILLQRIDLLKSLNRQDEIKSVIQQIAENGGNLETDQIKVAQLYIQNDFKKDGEGILKRASELEENLLSQEALASFYLAELRKEEAIEIMKGIAERGSVDVLIRTTKKLASANEEQLGYDLLLARKSEFSGNSSYLSAVCQLGISSHNEEEVIPVALDLLHLSEKHLEIKAAVATASRVLSRAGKEKEFIELLKDKESIQDQCLLVQLHLMAKDLGAAEQVLASRVNAKDTIATYFWTEILKQQKQYEKASQLLEGLLSTDEGKKPLFLKKLVALLNQTGEYDKALEMIKKWKVVAPNDKQAWVQESNMLAASGELEGSIQSLRRAIARFENNTDLQDLISQKYVEIGNYEEAIQTLWAGFNNALTIDEKINWSKKLIRTSGDIGLLYEVKNKFLSLRGENPKAIAPILALYQVSDFEENLEEKFSYLKEALTINPDNDQLLSIYASLAEKSGDFAEAELVLIKASQKSKDNSVDKKLLQFYLRTGNEEKAISVLNRIKQFDSARELEIVALSMIAGGSNRVADSLLRGGLVQFPDDWRLYALLGFLMEKKGLLHEAVKYYTLVHTAENTLENLQKTDSGKRYAKMTLSSFISNFNRYKSQQYSFTIFPAQNSNYILPESIAYAGIQGEIALVRIHAITTDKALKKEIAEHMEKTQTPHLQIKSELAFQSFFKKALSIDNLPKKYRESEYFLESRITKEVGNLTHNELLSYVTDFAHNGSISGVAGVHLLSKAKSTEEYTKALEAVEMALEKNGNVSRTVFRALTAHFMKAPPERTEEELQQVQDLIVSYYESSKEYQSSLYLLGFFLETEDYERFTATLKQATSRNKWGERLPYRITSSKVIERFYNGHTTIAQIYKAEEVGVEKRLAFLKTVATQVDDYWRFRIYEVIGEKEKAQIAREEAMKDPHYRFILRYKAIDPNLEVEEIFEIAKELKDIATDKGQRAVARQILLSCASEMDEKSVRENQNLLRQELAPFMNTKSVSYYIKWFAQKFKIKVPTTAKPNTPVLATSLSGNRDSAKRKMLRYIESGQKERAAKFLADYARDAVFSNNSYYLNNFLRETERKGSFRKEALEILSQGADQDVLKAIPYYVVCVEFQEEARAKNIFKNLNDLRFPEPWRKSYEIFEKYLEDKQGVLDTIVNELKESTQSLDYYVNPPFSADYDSKAWINWLDMASAIMSELDAQEMISQEGIKINQFEPVLLALMLNQNFNSDHYNSFYQINTTDERQAPKREFANRVGKVAIKHAFTAEIGYHILNFITPKATIEGRTYLQQFLLAGGLLTESYRTQHKSYWTYLVNASGSSLDKELFTLIAGGQVDEILPQDFLTTLKGKQPNTAEFIEHLISISKLKEADLKKKIETLQSDFELPEQKEHEYFIAAQYLLPFTYKSMKAQLPELEKKIQEIFENNTYYNQGVFDELMTIYSRAEKKLSLAECEEMHLALVESVLGKKEDWGDTDLSKGSKELKKLQAFLRFDQHFSTNKNLIYLLSRSNWRYGIPSQNNNMWGLAQDLSNKIIHAKSSDTIKAMEDLNLLTDTKDFFPLSVKHSDWNDPFTFRDKQNIFQNIGSGSDSKRLKLIKDLKARNEGRFGSLFVAAMIGDYQNRRKALESLFSEYADDLVKLPDWQLSAIGFTVSEHYNYKYNSNPKLAKLNQRFAEIKREEYEKRAQVLINRLNSKDPLSSYNNQIYGLRLDVQELLNEFIYSNPEKAVEIFKGYSKAVTVYYSNGGHYSNHSYNSLQVSLFEELLVNLASQARRDNSNSPEANIDFFSFLDKALREKDINEGLSFGFNFSQESNYLMGYFVDSIDRDSDKISKRTTPWLVLDEVVKKLEEKGEEAMLSYALLNYFVREKQWKIGLEHEVVQNWEKKAPKSLLYQACMVLANYSCEIPDEGQRLERQLPLMKEYFDRLEEYPQIIAPLKVEILQQKLNSHTQKHLLQDPEWHALMMRYLPQVFNGKRSGRSLMTEKLLVNYNMVSRVKPELAREALPILYKGIAKPIIGEPAEIPERLAGEIMQLALLTNDNAIVATILQSSKGKLKGELKYVEILLRERSFKSLRALLPTSSQEYKVSSLNTLYDVKLEHALTEFKAEGVGALQLARLEIALLELDDAKNGDKPQENKVDRIARLSSTISKYKTIDKKVLLQCLTILTSWNKSVPVPELAEELLKNDTLENLIHDYYYGGNSLEVQKKLPLKVSLIATQLGKGKTDELELYAKVLENENNYYLLSQFLPTLNEIAIFEIPKLIQADNKNALNEILAFYERALASSLSRGGGNTATSMISLAKLIAGHLNRFDEVFEWRSKVGPEYREFFDDREKDSDIDYYYSKILRNSPNWLEPANKEKRVKLYKWLLQQPGTIKSAPKERALSRSNYAVDKFITQEEYVILAQDKEIPASHRKLMLQNALFYTEDEEKLAIHYHIVALGDKVEPKALVDSSIVVVNELLKEEKYAEIEEILKEIPRKNLPNKLKKKLLSVQRKINRNKK